MLSRKQTWRRQVKHIHRLHPDAIYEQGRFDRDINGGIMPTRTQSEPTFYSQLFYSGKYWSTTGDLQAPQVAPKKKKSVKFSTSVKVILIPKREEYVDAGIDSLIWWGDSDYVGFKESAVSEMRQLMALDSRIDSVAARRILYQPQGPTKLTGLASEIHSVVSNSNKAKDMIIHADNKPSSSGSKPKQMNPYNSKSVVSNFADNSRQAAALHPLGYMCN